MHTAYIYDHSTTHIGVIYIVVIVEKKGTLKQNRPPPVKTKQLTSNHRTNASGFGNSHALSISAPRH